MGALEIPDDCRKEDYGRFHEEVALLLHPRFVQIKHDRVGALVCVGNVLHEVGVNGVAAVRASRVVEIDHIKFRLHLVPVQVVHQVVVGNGREVWKLEM